MRDTFFFGRNQPLTFSWKSCRRNNNSFILVLHIKFLTVANQEYTKKEWIAILNERLAGTPREAARYYGLEILPRLMTCLQSSRHSCDKCARYFEDLERMTFKITALTKENDPGVKQFQTLKEDIGKHLKDTHRLVARGIIRATFVTLGMATGGILSFAAGYIFNINDPAGIVMLGFIAGIISGWITGKVREAVLNKQNRLF